MAKYRSMTCNGFGELPKLLKFCRMSESSSKSLLLSPTISLPIKTGMLILAACDPSIKSVIIITFLLLDVITSTCKPREPFSVNVTLYGISTKPLSFPSSKTSNGGKLSFLTGFRVFCACFSPLAISSSDVVAASKSLMSKFAMFRNNGQELLKNLFNEPKSSEAFSSKIEFKLKQTYSRIVLLKSVANKFINQANFVLATEIVNSSILISLLDITNNGISIPFTTLFFKLNPILMLPSTTAASASPLLFP
mmetsp:Transcript_13155/g.19653  ORF Transcript_13155/g.19653 Transcript_13155/m.19653 type:complete len:251 (-) Transcript_13155:588-1340(-)